MRLAQPSSHRPIQIRGVIVAEARIEPTQAETEEGEDRRAESKATLCAAPAGREVAGWAPLSHMLV